MISYDIIECVSVKAIYIYWGKRGAIDKGFLMFWDKGTPVMEGILICKDSSLRAK